MTRAPSDCLSRVAGLLLLAALGCGDVTGSASEELPEPGLQDAAYDVALSFDGVDDYASLGTARVPQIMRAQSALLWFSAEPGSSGASEGRQVLFTMRRSDASGWVLTLDDGVPFAYNIYGAKSLSRAPMAVSTGAWHHVAFVIDTGGCRLYLDGSEVATGGAPATKRTPTQAFLGSLDGFQQMFHGSLDELRLYDRAVSADEVARAASGQPPDPETGSDSLVMFLPFDEASGARAFDRSGLGNHAELGDGVPELMPSRVKSGVPR